ncbi:NAD(P)H-binding protein [Actinophytocola sp.]|uniref:NAD(P)H-binding protein n=1 Tax=Actinophytocola sp. TaxID=1872138 RepID=UPI00389A7065
MPTESRVLVTAATGNVGPHAVAGLLDAGAGVRALVLPDDPAADRLPAAVERHVGNLSDVDSVAAALDGITDVFLMWPFFTLDVTTAPAVVEVLAERVRRVVFVSSVGVHIGLERRDNNCHAYLEELLEATDLEWTFLRTTGFMANALGFAAQVRTGDVVRFPYGTAARTPVHEADLAAVGVRALTGDGHAGVKYLVTGPEVLTQQEQVSVIGEVLGRDLKWEDVPAPAAREQMVAAGWPPAYADGALDYFAMLTREPELLSPTVPEVLGRPARTFRTWAEEHAERFH